MPALRGGRILWRYRARERSIWKGVPSLGRHTLVAQSVCCVDVRVVWCVARVVIGRLYIPSRGRHTIVARACERGAFLACERGMNSCLLARLDRLRANIEFGRRSVFERPLRRRLNASVSSAGRWLRVAGRGSMVAGRGSRVAGHGARFRRSGATLSSRGTSVTRTFGRCGTSSMSPAAFRPPPFPMRGPMSIGTDCRNRRKSCPCQLEDNAFRRSIACARARHFPCVRAMQFFRASEARPLACEA
jgi:hypothetical protein